MDITTSHARCEGANLGVDFNPLLESRIWNDTLEHGVL